MFHRSKFLLFFFMLCLPSVVSAKGFSSHSGNWSGPVSCSNIWYKGGNKLYRSNSISLKAGQYSLMKVLSVGKYTKGSRLKTSAAIKSISGVEMQVLVCVRINTLSNTSRTVSYSAKTSSGYVSLNKTFHYVSNGTYKNIDVAVAVYAKKKLSLSTGSLKATVYAKISKK